MISCIETLCGHNGIPHDIIVAFNVQKFQFRSMSVWNLRITLDLGMRNEDFQNVKKIRADPSSLPSILQEFARR